VSNEIETKQDIILNKQEIETFFLIRTLPIPQKHNCSATLYMAWLELLTYNMPPFLLIRGNQTSVLTFYC
jgi:solute carrier family 12 sodium/potassium/chloride transporter 2